MKIALVHSYWFPTGGDFTYLSEIQRIHEEKGDIVGRFGILSPKIANISNYDRFVPGIDYVSSNPGKMKVSEKIRVSLNIAYNRTVRKELDYYIRYQFKPDIVQLNSIHTTLSASVFGSLIQHRDVGVFWRVLDYKLVCPNRTLISGSNFNCRSCIEAKNFLPVLRQKCKRSSIIESALSYIENTLMTVKRNVERVDGFLCQSEFSANLLAEFGIPLRKIHVVYNPIRNLRRSEVSSDENSYILFFGRLSEEKGVMTLLNAIKGMRTKLYIVGDGPQKTEIESYVYREKMKNVAVLGPRWGDELKAIIAKAHFVVCPSLWNEVSPYVILQSYQQGKAVLGSKVGGIPDIVEPGKTGELFEAGDEQDLRRGITKMLEQKDNYDADYIRTFAQSKFGEEIYYNRVSAIFSR